MFRVSFYMFDLKYKIIVHHSKLNISYIWITLIMENCITSDSECKSFDNSLNRVLNGSSKPGYFDDGNQLC